MKRPKPKDRRTDRRCACERHKPTKQQPKDEPLFAPPHLGGQFEVAGYSTGRVVFGFTQNTTN